MRCLSRGRELYAVLHAVSAEVEGLILLTQGERRSSIIGWGVGAGLEENVLITYAMKRRGLIYLDKLCARSS